MSMAKYLISPGVSIREIDQSQYAATNPGTANVAVLVGYAEKGSFEPTLVTGQQDFVTKFGKTLKNIPYLAQAAYKFFEEGQVLLVVRAGDNRDVEAYPNAAQYASKTIRIEPEDVEATEGYQEFKAIGGLMAGSYSPSIPYVFKTVTDFKAFESPKVVDTWGGVFAETYNGGALPIPSITLTDAILKMAADSITSNVFSCNFKRDHSDGSTAEFVGSGSRTGTVLGSTFTASSLSQYRKNDAYADSTVEYVAINGTYGAAVIGTINLNTGFDWENTPQSFKITLGSVTYTVSLDTACANIDAVITHINSQLADVIDDGTSLPADISSKVEASKLTVSTGTSYAVLKHKAGPETGFTLAQGTTDALVAIGWAPVLYSDTNGLTGTWNAVILVGANPTNYSGTFAFNKSGSASGLLSFQDAIDVTVTAPANGTWTLSNISSQIQAALNGAYPSYNNSKARGSCEVNTQTGKIRITANSPATDEYQSITRITTGTGNSLISLLNGTETYVDGVAAHSVGEALITLKAKEKGSYGNKLMLRTEIQTVKTGQTTISYDNVYVLLDGKEVAAYPKVNWTDPDASNYILTKMANDAYISIEAVDENEDSTLTKLPVGDWTLGDGELPNGVDSQDAEITEYTVGTNGWVETDEVITSMSADFVNALDLVSNPEVYGFNLVAAPGDASPTVQNAIQDLCESRRDCFGVIDAAEFGLGLGVKDKTREITEVNDACSTLTSSFVGAFWPWVQDYDSDNQQYIWLPPSIYALKAMVYTDNINDPWWAPAGLRRGKVSGLNVEYSPTNTDRDILYGDTAIVNPIVKFVNEGIAIWGQKTAQRTTTATNRINVRRLLIYSEKLIAKMARSFLFEPNDSSNWAAFARQANAILEPIRQRRGLYQFQVICDDSTNPPELIDQNIMAGKIFLQPTKVIEYIQVDFTISASGELTVTEGI